MYKMIFSFPPYINLTKLPNIIKIYITINDFDILKITLMITLFRGKRF